jgi:nitrogen fixation/metabolism regulation signal transduction histidine kinase
VWAKYLFTTVLGLLYLSLNFGTPTLNSDLIVLVWLLLYLLIYERRGGDLYLPLMRSSFFLLWLIIFSASVSSLIIYQNRIDEIEQRKKIAEKLAMQTDPSGENLMSMAVTHFNDEFLSSNFYRFKSEASNNFLKDSLINENFSGYLNKYDTRIYTFDAAQNPLFNDDVASYEVISNIITNQSKPTGIDNLYYYENSLDRFSYLFQKSITDSSGNTLGYFFVIAKPKRYKSEALYPELFKQVKDISTDLNVNYAYAVYNKNEILISSGTENFPSHLSKQDYPKLEYEVRNKGETSQLWYNSGNKIVVISRSSSVFYEAITLFAYLFGIFLCIVVLFQLAGILFRSRFRWRSIKAAFRFSIRSQIQSTIIFISIFSFVVIGVATISFYIKRFNETNNERLVRAIKLMAAEIQDQLASQMLMDDAVKIYDLGASDELQNTINNVSEIHNVDVNFYGANAVLRISTQPYIYNKHILSEMMEPKAYLELHYNNQIQYTQREQVGRFTYLSIYVPIKGKDGQTYAYLNIPYLNSQSELNQEISNFILILINLNAFIFVLASAIALLLTNRITRSFSLIGDKMKEISLGKFNEQIDWNSNDEIGALVVEYNKMVKKLEDSAQALAKVEREGAWREMARQVAHEIKNPLTPMKLSLQYLQRAIDEKKPDVKDLARRVSSTLVEQIDQLAKIASDFSQFANIGNVQSELFDLNNIIVSLIDLHSTNERVEIKWKKPTTSIKINADRLQVNRLFTNLIQNAIEASTDKEKALIEIVEEINDDYVFVSVKDDGMGIPKEKQDKIFTPNFTTKSSGTGLGLAICKGIVEKAQGKIWFETEEGKGTTFYVQLPLAEATA